MPGNRRGSGPSGGRGRLKAVGVVDRGPARHPRLGTRDGRIDYVVKMMTERRWFGGRSHRELASAWGLHPSTVEEIARTAAAVLDRHGSGIEAYINEKLVELETIERRAMARTKVVKVVCKECGAGYEFTHPDPDTKAATEAVRLQLQARGALIQRHQVQATVATVPAIEAMGDGELATWLADQLVEREYATVVAALAKRGIQVVEPPKLTEGT